MSRVGSFLLALAFMLAAAGCAFASEDASQGAERETVLATLESWNRGWAERSAELAIQDFAEDADWTYAFGDCFRSSCGSVRRPETVWS